MPNLILIPTEIERRVLEPLLRDTAARNDWSMELVGFGLVAAAARTSQLIARHRPKTCCLIGIAGGFSGRGPEIGTATEFDSIACHGIGVGTGSEYRSASQLGWAMIQGDSKTIGDHIELRPDAGQARLLSVCAASANPTDAAQRQAACPDAIAEDMEGFGVAMSCQIAGVDLRIVRGISNEVGDRDHQNWQIDPALRAAAELAMDQVIGASL